MKKLFLFIICAVLSIGARAQFSGSGNGTEADPYRIYTDIHLAQMANFLNQEGVVFELMKDVDLSNYISENSPSQGWTPIGVESAPFKGVLKGNGHTISGLTINRPNNDHIGFFGYVNGTTITDLTIKASNIIGQNYVSVLCGTSYGSCSFTNCDIEVSGKLSGLCDIGGIIGYMHEGSKILDCDVIGNIESKPGSTLQCGTVGGIGGTVEKANILNCTFNGSVMAKVKFAGGLIGSIHGCSLNECVVKSPVSGEENVGGLCGIANETNTILNCRQEGYISGTANVSGGIGLLEAGSSNTFNNFHHKGTITNTGDYTGGIVGRSKVGIAGMENCSHFSNITGKNYVGGIIGYDGGIIGSNDSFVLHRYTWSFSSTAEFTSTGYDTFSDEYVNSRVYNVANCTAIGNIVGENCVGGLIGADNGLCVVSTRIGYRNTRASNYYFWEDGKCIGYKIKNEVILNNYCRTDYTYTDCYYSGNITGKENIGGIAGKIDGGVIKNCYTTASLYAESNVGGIVGYANEVNDIKSNVAINSYISASSSYVGRIFGRRGNNVAVGSLGSPESNRALTQTSVMLCGVAQDVIDDEQNGTSVGPSMLRLKANYVSWGWNFDDNWNILETECYPYKKYQAAPPVIESTLQSQDTEIRGKSLNGGTVYMFYKDRDAVSTDCDGYNWAFTTEALQSGAQVQLYADVDGMTPSYLTSATVKYPGLGTEDDPYRIYTAEDLQGATNSGYYKLMNDIDLTSWINENSPEKGWPAIGRNSTVATYINGDGHKVTGLWINTTEGYNGLFSNYSAGYIKNLNVEVAAGKKVKGGDYTGILIGRMANGQIINCSVKGDVEGSVNVGGVAGYVTNSTVSNSTFEGKVNTTAANAFAGGVSGLADNVETISCRTAATITTTGEGSCVGGLYGKTNNGSITKSTADANITASGASNYVGGLVGRITSPVTFSYSTGTVTASGNDSYTGGLVGYAEASIANSYSTANVSGTQFSAGLVGYTFSTVDKCYASGNVSGVMYGAGLVGELDGINASATNSVAANNKLELSAQSAWGCRVIGGFKNECAEPNNSNFALNTMQVSLNNVPQKKTDDNIEGIAKTLSELQSSATYLGIGWNLTKDWSIEENSTYPFLLWEVDVNPIVDITLDKTSLIIPVGNTATITASVLPLSATNKRVEWKSSKESVATVEGGIVTAVGQGTAVITATTTDGSNLSATCNVTVVANHDDAIAELNNLVDNSLALYNNSSEGDNIGQYAAGSRAALLKVINGVRAQISSTMDEAAISECTTLINDAVALFQSKKVSAGEDTDVTLLDNTVYIDNVEAAAGGEVVLSVKMKNTIQVTGFQFNMYLPNGVNVAKDGDGFCDVTLSTDRTSALKTNTFDSSIMPDGSLLVLAASTKNYTFSGTDGEVAKIRLVIDSDVDEGDYPIIFKTITLTNAAGQTQDVDYLKRTLTVSSYTIGDVNTDGRINVGDYSAIASHIMGDTPDGFVVKAADVNQDTKINVGDLSAVVTIIMNGGVASNAKGVMASQRVLEITDVNDLDNAIYSEEMNVAAGNDAELVFNMKNDIAATGFQFDFALPDGFSVVEIEEGFYDASLSTIRTTPTKTNTFECGMMANGEYRILAASTRNYEFSGNDGEVVRVKIHADENLIDGTYPFEIKNIVITDAHGGTIDVDKVVSEITVGASSYADGYAIDITPFEFNEDVEMPILLDNADDVTNVEFDLMLPQTFIENELHYIDAKLAKTKFTTSIEDITGGVHVSIARRSSNKLVAGEDSEIAVLGLVFDDVAEGVYTVETKNIIATTTDGDEVKVAPYKASILVGNPTLSGDVKLYGKYTSDEYSLIENVAANNEANVTCERIILSDSEDCFLTNNDIVAEEIEYEATVSASLGYKTLVLPYNCAVPASFEAYEVGSLSGNILSLVQVESITANKPVILKNAGTASLSAMNVTVNATNGATMTNGKLVGTYTKMSAPVGSYVLQNQGGNVAFYQVVAGKQPVIGPFRAYLEASGAGAKTALMIGDGATAVLDTKSGALIENIEGVFNAAGVRKANITDGVNIIRTADGEVKKIMK